MVTPEMVRLLVIVIGLGLLITGMVITVIKRHEKGGFSAGIFLLAASLVFGIAFNSAARSTSYQKDAQDENVAETALTWLQEQNNEVKTAIANWVFT